MRVGIRALGLLAPGLGGWDEARRVLGGEVAFDAHDVRPQPSLRLGAAERRRLNANSAWALAVASEALDGVADDERGDIASVFATADGDGETLGQSLAALSAPAPVLSPTLFHNSVFNAPAGYVSIAHRLTGPSTTLCAAESTFATAIVESHDQLDAGARRVLLVLVDTAFPASLASLRASSPSFACAMFVGPSHEGAQALLGTWSLAAGAPADHGAAAMATTVSPVSPVEAFFGSHTVAAALPLLAAIARRSAILLPLVGSAGMAYSLRYAP
ncbi:MAG: beta-ketoacyl synthase chain length factor [Burkholderiales bacterium]